MKSLLAAMPGPPDRMPRRFYIPQIDTGPRLRLTADPAHHLARVLRMQPGDALTLFDGRGTEVDACVETVAAGVVEILVRERRAVSEAAVCPVVLAVAPPKGDRFAWLVEKATELGVTRLVPLL